MKNNKTPKDNDAIKNYYELKTDAIEVLANPEKDDGTTVTQEEIDKYSGKRKFRIPDFLKYTLIKFWFAGAVYYFIGFGLGITNLLDQLFVLGIAMGMVTDLLTNNVIRFLEETPGSNDKWMLFSQKGYRSFVLNILFGFVVVICVSGIYWLLELIVDMITGDPASIHVGTEPVLFGLFSMAVDLLFVNIKHLFIKLIDRIRK